MIRLFLALLIVALLLKVVSGMLNEGEHKGAQSPEDTIVGAAYEPYTKAQQFDDNWDKALDAQRKDLDKQIDGDQ